MKTPAPFLLLFFHLVAEAQQGPNAVPDFATMQFGGSIGYVSGGFGYDVFGGHGRASAHYGDVPAAKGGSLNVFAAKLVYIPFVIVRAQEYGFEFNPIDIGILASWHSGSGVKSHWPDTQYPRGYYWWHPALRLHLLSEHAITYRFPEDNLLTAITGYVEFNINDLYLVSYVQNARSLRLTDVVKTGLGVRVRF